MNPLKPSQTPDLRSMMNKQSSTYSCSEPSAKPKISSDQSSNARKKTFTPSVWTITYRRPLCLLSSLGKPYGLEQKPKQAKLFYGVLIFASVAGITLNFSPIDPIKALYWSAVINGVAAVPSMVMIMKMSMNSKVMGSFTIGRSLTVWGWLATAAMAAAALVMFVTWGK